MLKPDISNYSLNRIRLVLAKNRPLLVLVVVVVAVLITYLAIRTVSQKPAQTTNIVPSAGSPAIISKTDIVFNSQPPATFNQSTSITLFHSPTKITEEEVRVRAVKFGFDPQPTRIVDGLYIWSKSDESLQIDINTNKLTYRKNPIINQKLLQDRGFSDQPKIITAALDFIEKNQLSKSLLDLASPEIEFVENQQGVYLFAKNQQEANTAVVSFRYKTTSKSEFITAGGGTLSMELQVVPSGIVIALDTYFGEFSTQDNASAKTISGEEIIDKLKNRSVVIRALSADAGSEAFDLRFADLRELTISKISTAYYFSSFSNLPQGGTLIAVGEGDAVTINNQNLRVWITAAL